MHETSTNSILIIDDDRALTRTLHLLLKHEGYRVITALSASEGRSMASASRPFLTLLDVHLPDGNGLELLEEMQRINPDGHFILMTGDSDIKTKIAATSCREASLLEKPFAIDEVLNRVAAKLSPP
ncbi:MAG: response regulator [Thermodesulfobacteriota bacterium]